LEEDTSRAIKSSQRTSSERNENDGMLKYTTYKKQIRPSD